MENQNLHQDEIQQSETNPGFRFQWIAGMVITVIIVAGLLLIMCFIVAKVDAKYRRCQKNCENIGSALLVYSAENNGSFPSKLEMLTPDYIKEIPTCPCSGSNRQYLESYRASDDLKGYTFYCMGRNHILAGTDRNYPQYNSLERLRAKP